MSKIFRKLLSPFAIICLIQFFAVSSFSLVSPILSIYAKDSINASIVEIGIITSVFFIASSSIKLPLGILGGGRRTPLLFTISLFLLIVVPFTYILISSWIGLAIVRLIHGIAFALVLAISYILVPLTVREHLRHQAVATFSVLSGIGLLTGSGVGTLIVAFGNLIYVFYLASILGVPGFILGSIFSYKLYSIEGRWFLLKDEGRGLNLRKRLVSVLSNKAFLVAFFACFSYFFVLGTVLAYAPLHARYNLSLPYFIVTAMFFGLYITTTLTRLSLGKLISNRIMSKGSLVLLAGFLSIILIAVAVLSDYSYLFIFGIILFGIPQGIILPVGAMMVSESVRPTEHVLANSFYLVAWDIGFALGPMLTSSIANSLGILTALGASTLLPVISVILILFTKESLK
ncbi:MFS transporter [[Eubacterium] cellulosolvens]